MIKKKKKKPIIRGGRHKLKLSKKKSNNYFLYITTLLKDLFSHAKHAVNTHVGTTQALNHSFALWNFVSSLISQPPTTQ